MIVEKLPPSIPSLCSGLPIDVLLCAQVTARLVVGSQEFELPTAPRTHDLYYREHPLPMVMDVNISVCELEDFSTLGSCLGLGCLRSSR